MLVLFLPVFFFFCNRYEVGWCYFLLKWFAGNILYVEDKHGWRIRPIDFEYCSYNYRLEELFMF